jgi:hypothetical protein
VGCAAGPPQSGNCPGSAPARSPAPSPRPCVLPTACAANNGDRLLADLGVTVAAPAERQLGIPPYQCACDGQSVLKLGLQITACLDTACTVTAMEAPCLDTACTALIKGCTPGAVVSYDTCNPRRAGQLQH